MPTDLRSFWELLHQTGALELVYQSAGAAAGGAAVLTLLCVLTGLRSSVLRAFSVLTVLAVLALLCAGAYGTFSGYRAADAAVASVTPPSVAERQKQTGYAQARVHLVSAVGLSGVPLVLGLVGLIIAGRRRWRDNPDRPEYLRRLVATVVLVDLIGIGGETIAWKLPLPGRDLDETGWKVVELDEAIGQQQFEACLTMDTVIDPKSRARRLPQFRNNVKRCAEHFLQADPKSAKDPAGDLKRLLAAPWFDDAAQRAKVQARLDELAKPPEPTAAELEAARQKTLAQEEEAARAKVTEVAQSCFDPAIKKARKRKPLSVNLQITIATMGEVQSVEETKGALEPAALKKCVVDAVKKLKLANSSGADRQVTVALAFR